MMKLFLCLRHRSFSTLTLKISSPFSTAAGATVNVPVLYKPKTGDVESDGIGTTTTTTLQLLSWGRGASGQLGGGIEEIRLYLIPVANLLVPSSSFAISPPPGRISVPNGMKADNIHGRGVVEVGICCGLFHLSLLVDDKFWIWGKGDCGRLGFGHENSLFVPTVNPPFGFCPPCGFWWVAFRCTHFRRPGFTWGYGGFGALGHSVYHRELFPRLVECPWNCKICRIATSGTHTAAITEAGELYTWGRDEGDGRLVLVEGGGLSVPCCFLWGIFHNGTNRR